MKLKITKTEQGTFLNGIEIKHIPIAQEVLNSISEDLRSERRERFKRMEGLI